MGLHLLFFPFAWMFNLVPYAASPVAGILPEFTPAVQTILQISTMIIALSTGFTSVGFYNEKRLTNKISESAAKQTEKIESLQKALDKLETNLCNTIHDGLKNVDLHTDTKIVNAHTKINNVEQRLGRVENMFWDRAKGEKNI